MRSIPRLGAASRRPGSRRHAYWRRQGRRLAAAALAALAVLIAVGGPLVALPALFLLNPSVARAAVGPVPVSWLVVGVVVYPFVYAAARLHVRQSERIERDFTDLMNRQQ